MEKSDSPPEAADPSLPPPKTNPWPRILAVARILIFTAIITATAVFMLPKDIPNYLSLVPWEWLIAGIILIALPLGAIFYFLLSLAEGRENISFDLEPIAAIVIGIMAIMFVGVTTILTSNKPEAVAPTLIFITAYTFYIYRMIKKVIQMRQENEEVKKQYKDLLAIDKEKSDFITVTSHQLRTPLTEVRWSLGYALQMPGLDPQINSTLQKTLESVERLAKIVDDILKARTFEHNDILLNIQPVDTETLIRKIMENLELFAEKQKTSVSFSPPEHKIIIGADPEKIKMALENIIDNAIRYSPNGKVSISTASGEGKATIQVEDTGVGIDSSDQNMIFTKFFRAKNALLVQPDGSGIGLYATKSIIQKHEGTINFFSELNKGTKFIITLPLAK